MFFNKPSMDLKEVILNYARKEIIQASKNKNWSMEKSTDEFLNYYFDERDSEVGGYCQNKDSVILNRRLFRLSIRQENFATGADLEQFINDIKLSIAEIGQVDQLPTAANSKTEFLDNLQNRLKVMIEFNLVTRIALLDYFDKLKDRNGPFQFIHQQRHAGLNSFSFLIKFEQNKGEHHFWHTGSYQEAVKFIKEAYLSLNDDCSITTLTDKEREAELIDYKRGNLPIHF